MIGEILLSSTVMLYVGLLLLAAGWDFAGLRIPNLLTGTTAALFIAYGVLALGPGDWALHLVVAAGVFLLALSLFAFGLIGGGDAKLLTVVGLWTGAAELPAVLVITAIAGAALALFLVSVRPYLWALASCLPAGVALRYVPRSMQPGAGIPYGVPIAVAAIVATVF